MKYFALFLTLMMSFSCSKNKSSKNEAFNIDPEQIRQEQERIVREQVEESLSEAEIKTCEVNEARPDFLSRVANGFVGIFKRDGFDIVFPKELSDKIIQEILNSVYANLSFNPQDFWTLLTPETADELNRILLNANLTASEEEFSKIRSMAAFLYLFYFQLEEKEKGYELYLEEQNLGISRLKVAFDQTAIFDERVKLSFCEKISLIDSEFKELGDDYLTPGDISGQVICERRGDRVLIEQYTNRTETYFSITTASGLSDIITVDMPRDTEIEEDYSEITMSFPQRNLELVIERQQSARRLSGSVLRGYRPNSFRRLDIEGLVAGERVRIRNLSCREVKDVIYQAR